MMCANLRMLLFKRFYLYTVLAYDTYSHVWFCLCYFALEI